MKKGIYSEYAKTKHQMIILTEKLKGLETQILDEIKSLSTPMKNEYGTYLTVHRTIIKLSATAVKKQTAIKKDLSAQVKAIEEEDIKSGKAKTEEVIGLRFIENKEK